MTKDNEAKITSALDELRDAVSMLTSILEFGDTYTVRQTQSKISHAYELLGCVKMKETVA